MTAPTINKIEIAEMSLASLLRFDLSVADRAALEAAVKVVNGLRPNVNAADHQPVFMAAQNGDTNVVGCSCGETPKKASARMSMSMAFFNTHLGKVGLPRDYGTAGNQQPRYTDGPRAGMTMAQAIRAGL